MTKALSPSGGGEAIGGGEPLVAGAEDEDMAGIGVDLPLGPLRNVMDPVRDRHPATSVIFKMDVGL